MNSTAPLFIGVDVGTQSVKLLAYDAEAKVVAAQHSQPLDLIACDDGTREQQAEWWTDAIRACFARLGAAQRSRVAAIGVSGQQHGFVPVGRAGDVLAPVKLWCDTSTQVECDEITSAVGGANRCIALAGNPILVGYTASKARWTRKHRTDVHARTVAVMLPHDYVNYWLTGERWMEYGDASGTGWLDIRNRTWSPQLLAATDGSGALRSLLPPLVDAAASFGIAPMMAEQLDLPRTVLVSAGGGDNMMAAIGTGNVQPGVLSLSLGTSGTLFAYSATPIVDAAGRWAAFCSSTGGWLPLVCTMNCTAATETVAHSLGFDSRAGDAMIACTRPGADGLTMLPFFNGERTPDLPHARASLHGMTGTNLTHGNVYRAAMEGATFALRNGFDALAHAAVAFDSIRLTGGGGHSAIWRQMVADVFSLPVEVPNQVEGAAFGAALQALWVHSRRNGSDGDIAETARTHVSCDASRSAQPTEAEAYAGPYEKYLRRLESAYQSDDSRHLVERVDIPATRSLSLLQ
jgi:xylulokinase